MNTKLSTIEVFVEHWQLDCCGTPFAVGATVTWDIHADEPVGEIARFIEDHHDLVDESVPSWEVSGRVVEIVAVSNRLVAVPGATFTTNDASDVGEDRVEKAKRFHPAPEGFTPVGFRVRLAIEAGTLLPRYVEAPWREAQRERDRVLEETITVLHDSEVGRRLSQLSDRIAEEYSGRVERRSDRTGVTIQPLAPNRCVVMWMHSPKKIEAHIGDGTWSLSATPKGVMKLERFIAAASRGDVQERVFPGRFATIVLDGETELARKEVKSILRPGISGFAPMTEVERRRRGDVDYEPW